MCDICLFIIVWLFRWFVTFLLFVNLKHLLFRYVATSVTTAHEMENGFIIWAFNGKLLYRILKDNFYQV